MPHAIQMPKFGQTVEESTIVKWMKKPGDAVAKGDILFEIETDKSNLEVEAFVSGTLLKVLVPEGGTVPVMSVVAYVGEPGEKVPDAPAPAAKPEPKPEPKATTPAPAPKAAAPAPVLPPIQPALSDRKGVEGPSTHPPIHPSAAQAPKAPERLRISPRAKALARQSVIDPSRISGSGPDGRIVEKDVKAWLDQHGYADLRVTPAAKQLAAGEGIDLLAVSGTGDGGRITVEDIRGAAEEKPQPLTKMRQVIAQRLTQSFMTVPHIFVSVDVDVTDLLAFRQTLKAAGKGYTVNDFVAEAVVLSLQEHRPLNSSTDGRTVRWSRHVHLGIAVTLETGLVVPVVRQADRLSLAELSVQAKALGDKARAGKLTPDEMTGGTFTISNMGMLGVDSFTAIINPPEAGILAVASARRRPAVVDGKIVARDLMTLTLSADHRIVDGAVAARFVNAVKSKLEDLELWKLLT